MLWLSLHIYIFIYTTKVSKILFFGEIYVTTFDEGENSMDIKTLLDLIANQGFPTALSILLIFRIDRFMQEIIIAQKEGYLSFFADY